MEREMNLAQADKETRLMQEYMADAYRRRREELGLTKEEVAKRIGRTVATVTNSEKSFTIGLHEIFSIGRDCYNLDVHALLDEAEAYAKKVVMQAE